MTLTIPSAITIVMTMSNSLELVLETEWRCAIEERCECELNFPLQASPRKGPQLWEKRVSGSNPSAQESTSVAKIEGNERCN